LRGQAEKVLGNFVNLAERNKKKRAKKNGYEKDKKIIWTGIQAEQRQKGSRENVTEC